MKIFVVLAAFAAAPAALQSQTSDTSRTRPDTAHTLEAVTVAAIRARTDAPVSANVTELLRKILATLTTAWFFTNDL